MCCFATTLGNALWPQSMSNVSSNRMNLINARFRIEQVLGRGGMGIVYRVHDEMLNKVQALKVMRRSLVSTPELQHRFLVEINALRRLTHPGIVRAFDCGIDEAENRAFFAMEYIEGEPLSAVLERRREDKTGPLEVEQAIEYLRELLLALTHAHEHVIHRDLKPQNIIVRSDGSLVVLDFGLAKILSDEQFTRSAIALGTVGYMSPEQGRPGTPVDIRSDIYSVGVILYELLTLKRPQGHFGPPSTYNPAVPSALDHVIMKCLKPEPDERYPDAPSLLAALNHAAGSRTGRRGGVFRWFAVIMLAAGLIVGSYLVLDRLITAESPDDLPIDTTEIDDVKRLKTDSEGLRPASTVNEVSSDAIVERSFEIAPGLAMAIVWIPPGEFLMGSPATEEGRDDVAEPQPHVRISRGFWLGKYEVMQSEWEAVMGSNPSYFQSIQNPVESVSWDDCQEFLRRLGGGYRLPTEAEWEYACRAGTTTAFHFGGTISPDQANYDGNYPYGNGQKGVYQAKTISVGTLPGNAWGLHDMHGNVWEWCHDWYASDYDGPSPAVDPEGPAMGSLRVVRGGSWFSEAKSCRSAIRNWFSPQHRSYYLGFRVALPASIGD